ncbi:acyl-CoA thioesterase [Streptomyces sp. NPDC002795]|uniref:acyl-CoA thioesterase n=1 Tax=Streptomyces sp. NPDC002795 TaxID=3364665 RepID=UPI0036C66EA9
MKRAVHTEEYEARRAVDRSGSLPVSDMAPTGLAVRLDVRVSDLGPDGHVNNVAHLRLLDEARSRLLGPGPAGRGGGILDVLGGRARLVIGQHVVEYRREVRPPVRSLLVRLWVPVLGSSSLALAAAIFEDGYDDPAVVAESGAVLLASGTGRPWPMDGAAREVLGRYTGPRPVFRGRVGLAPGREHHGPVAAGRGSA